jgi:hypothetical protein
MRTITFRYHVNNKPLLDDDHDVRIYCICDDKYDLGYMLPGTEVTIDVNDERHRYFFEMRFENNITITSPDIIVPMANSTSNKNLSYVITFDSKKVGFFGYLFGALNPQQLFNNKWGLTVTEASRMTKN